MLVISTMIDTAMEATQEVIDKGPQVITGDAALRMVASNAVAMFNRVLSVGDVVIYRPDQGMPTTGFRLTAAARVDGSGAAVCEVDGFGQPVMCDRIRPFASVGTKPARVVKSRPVGNLF